MTSEFAIAVHALVFLNHKKTIVSSENLSENVCSNPARIRKIMNKLKKNGLVETKEGIHGGYIFTKSPSDITLKCISDAINTTFVYSSWQTGNIDLDCLIASGMGNIMDKLYYDLDILCKEKLKEITIEDINRQIFS